MAKYRRILKVKNGYRVKFALPPRLQARFKKGAYSKSFTQPTYRTKVECLQAAIEHRNRLEQKWRLRISDWESEKGISNRIKCEWVATWREGPEDSRVHRSKAFPYKFGDKKSEATAKKKAQQYRAAMQELDEIERG